MYIFQMYSFDDLTLRNFQVVQPFQREHYFSQTFFFFLFHSILIYCLSDKAVREISKSNMRTPKK